MAPNHAVDAQGVPKQRPGSTKTLAAAPVLGVRKDANNKGAAVKPAAPVSPLRRDWQAGSGSEAIISKQAAPALAPTIRVIHIFAPKVIKTDMANFRSTVQKLTGRSTKKRGRRARSKSPFSDQLSGALNQQELGAALSPAVGASFPELWDQAERRLQEEELLHRFVGDACGANIMPLVRSSSEESSTYSLDSGHFSSESNETSTTDGLPSPVSATASDSFSFYVPHRESAYSLSEIPAPFLGADHMNLTTTSPFFASQYCSAAEHGNLGLHLPTPGMESILNFDVDNLGSGLASPLPLPDTTAGCDDVPLSFPSALGSGGSSGGGGNLYDVLSVQAQHCRLSVQQPPFQSSGNFFEMI